MPGLGIAEGGRLEARQRRMAGGIHRVREDLALGLVADVTRCALLGTDRPDPIGRSCRYCCCLGLAVEIVPLGVIGRSP